MFRDRIFEWSRTISSIPKTLSAFKFLMVSSRPMVFVLNFRRLEIDHSRVEMSREVSRAYIQPVQGNR